MPDEETTPGAPAAPLVTPPAPAATPEPQAGDGQEHISLEDARKLRSEAVNMRKRLKTYEEVEAQTNAAKKAADEAQLSELERVKKQHAETVAERDALRAEVQETKIQRAVERYATDLNFLYPETAIKLLNRSDLEYEENGAPKNVKHLLEEVLKAMPKLAKQDELPPPEPALPAAQRPPMTPAMNPARTSILQPGQGIPGKPTRLEDLNWSR